MVINKIDNFFSIMFVRIVIQFNWGHSKCSLRIDFDNTIGSIEGEGGVDLGWSWGGVVVVREMGCCCVGIGCGVDWAIGSGIKFGSCISAGGS